MDVCVCKTDWAKVSIDWGKVSTDWAMVSTDWAMVSTNWAEVSTDSDEWICVCTGPIGPRCLPTATTA